MIQTVTGKIKKEEIGTVLMHEHVSCSSLSFERAFGQRWLDKTRLESLAAEAIKQAGGKYRLGLMVSFSMNEYAERVNIINKTDIIFHILGSLFDIPRALFPRVA